MYRQFMRRTVNIALLCSAMCSSLSFAGKEDFKLPIKVDSKSQFVDGKSKTSVFRDDVHINQGSLNINADEVEVIAGLGEGKEVFVARGDPARYTQRMDDGSDIRALANEIEYQKESRVLTLKGGAELHQNSSMVKGELIIFNMELEQLIAQGTDDKEGRVTTIFQPNSVPGNKKQPETSKDKEQQP
jgi:lipopolysaccharide export system protein LptA